MSDNHSRFLNLERGRAQAPTAGSGQGSGARFDVLEQPGTPAPVTATGAVAERFHDAPAPAQAPLELAEQRPDDQPFIRCAKCEADNNFFATSCFNCGASFSTPEQRTFNERLWQQRRQEAEREEAALAGLREEKAKADREAADAKRQAIAMMAAGVAAETRNRLEREEREDAIRFTIRSGVEPESTKELIGFVAQNGKALLKLAGVGIFLLLLLIPETRRFALGAALVVLCFYFRFWQRWGRNGD